jgi:CDP-diacylglycerol pyrophosphatase
MATGVTKFGDERLRSARVAVAVAMPAALAVVGAILTLAPVRADPMALWRVVHDQCVPNVEAGRGPKPCETVYSSDDVAQGVAILKDLVGVAQMLAIPTRRIIGIEDPQMVEPDAPKVFAEGWKGRTFVEARLGKQLPREAVALAINSKWARSQDQLHVHVDCVAETVLRVLVGYQSALDTRWRAMTEPLNGRVYFARRLDSTDFEDAQPFRLLADELDGAKGHMGNYSLAAVGADFAGTLGFVLLADAFSLEGGGHAEDIQDHSCAVAHLKP